MSYVIRFASHDDDREAAFEVRRQVFSVEQNVPRPLDRDVHDGNADHVVALEAGRCIGTGRLVRVSNRAGQIGRIAVPAPHRRRGVGAAVLAALERMSHLRGLKELTVHSQLQGEDFLRNRGYARDGEVFLEQGVPHVLMRKQMVR
jgi:predicted GNAT family N-acyltransferase